MAFLCNVQSIRYYVHVSFLITVPISRGKREHCEYVSRNLNRASYFWSLGLRAFYFSFPLFLWNFDSTTKEMAASSAVTADYVLKPPPYILSGCSGAAYEPTNSGVSLGKESQGLRGQPQKTVSWIRARRQDLRPHHPQHLQQRRPPPCLQQRCSGMEPRVLLGINETRWWWKPIRRASGSA
ncbi:uncharacterized protein LOC108824904 [Raphanus sativus]|uniref:Uncharacterized protein LOC108824904 n=1 Tax=Raphanus sativus TaxID=3726 RepID=A0A9W3CDN1_RAPSA|nr:uncharacterized protein LOC108824904 [Raphanus sativus]